MPDESPERPFDQAKRILQEQILRNYPNPERSGCSGDAVLKRLALSGLPAEDDPHWQHLTHCSPCYAEFLEFRAEAKAVQQHTRQQRRLVLATVAAAVIALCTFWLFTRGPGHDNHPQRVRTQTAAPLVAKASPRSAYLDLERVETARGISEGGKTGLKLDLPVGNLNLEIRLPVGSEDGPYQVQILRNPGEAPVASGTGTAKLENHNELLRIHIDLGGLSPGKYYIAFRRDNMEWTVLPLDLEQ